MHKKSVYKKRFAFLPVLFLVVFLGASIFTSLNIVAPQKTYAANPPAGQSCPNTGQAVNFIYVDNGMWSKTADPSLTGKCVMSLQPGQTGACNGYGVVQYLKGTNVPLCVANTIAAGNPTKPKDCPPGTIFKNGACDKIPQSQADCPAGSHFTQAIATPKTNGVALNTCDAGAPAGGTTTEGPKLECEVSILNPLTWIVCPLVAAAQAAVEGLNDGINTMMNINTGKGSAFDTAGNTGQGYRAAWNTFRTFATGIIIIGGLLMIISQAAGLEVLDAYTVRKTLPRLLVAAIFISISWYLVAFLIQLSNDLGNSVRAIIYQPFSGIGNGTITLGQDSSLVASLVGGVGIYALGLLGLGTIAISALVAVLVGFTILIVRKLIILLLIIVAPLAIACYVLPNTQRAWTLWKDTLTSMLVVFPIISAFIAIGRVFAIIAYTSGGTGAFHVPSNGLEQTFATLATHLGFGADTSPGLLPTIEAFVAYFLPYLLMKQAFDLAGGLISTVKNGVGNASGGLQRGLSNYRGNRRKLRTEKHAANRQAFLAGNRLKGNGKFANAINSTGRTIGGIKHAGLRPGMWGSRMQAGHSIHEAQEMAEYMDKNAAFGAIKGNDDYLQATMKNMGGGETEADWRRYLSGQGYEGRSLEQGVAQIRAAKRGTSNEVFQRAAVVANASTGTGWKEGGFAQMAESINEAAGGDAHTANNMLAQMRGAAMNAQRTDLGGAGFGTSSTTMAALQQASQKEGGVTDADRRSANKQIANNILFTKDGGTLVARSRGDAVKNMAPFALEALHESHDDLDRAKLTGDDKQVAAAERALAQQYASLDNIHTSMTHSSPENAQIWADSVLRMKGADNAGTVMEEIARYQQNSGTIGGQAFSQTTKTYGQSEAGARNNAPPEE